MASSNETDTVRNLCDSAIAKPDHGGQNSARSYAADIPVEQPKDFSLAINRQSLSAGA
jgi:hypothetical protein